MAQRMELWQKRQHCKHFDSAITGTVAEATEAMEEMTMPRKPAILAQMNMLDIDNAKRKSRSNDGLDNLSPNEMHGMNNINKIPKSLIDHPVICHLSSVVCHPVILSSCHPVILSSCHLSLSLFSQKVSLC